MDWVSTAIGLFGRYMTGEKNRWGWMCAVAGGSIAFCLQASAGFYGLCLGNAIGIVMSIWYFVQWGRKGDGG